MRKGPTRPAVHEAVECLRKLTDLFRQRRQELASSVGLTEQQWAVLDEISNEDFMPSMFAKRRESSAAAVSKILRQLQDKELVVASLRPSDARQRNYELTALGAQVLGRMREHRQRALDEVWCTFDAGQLKAFSSFAHELIERLERHSRETTDPHRGRDTTTSRHPTRKGTKNGKDPIRQGV